MIEIRDIYGNLLFTAPDTITIEHAVEAAVRQGLSLCAADLRGVDLYNADLRKARLHGANLTGADLRKARLHGADLTGADLRKARLHGADLHGADLYNADLTGAFLSPWLICPESGSFEAYKKVSTPSGNGAVLRVRIDADVPRINAIGSRKCRAERVYVLGVVHGSEAPYYTPRNNQRNGCKYVISKYTVADEYVDDPRLECTGGIHFFMTLAEAKAW